VLIPIGGPLFRAVPQPDDPVQQPVLMAFKFLAGVFYGGFLTTSATVSADIADELELDSGEPRQALLSSFTFFSMFAASALVSVAGGIFLDIIEFPVGMPVKDVPVEAGNMLAIFSCIVISCAVSGVAFFVSRLDISAEKQRLINVQLGERYAAAKQGSAA
jgi:Na+/melibiose symporter-like transporter